MEELVSRQLVLQAATNAVPADLDQRVDQHLIEVKARLGGDAGLARALQEAGIAADEYPRQVRQNLILENFIKQYLSREATITAEEIRAYYDNNRAQFQLPEMVRASHILLRTPPDAPEAVKKEKRLTMDVIRARLERGEKFDEVARQVSEDPGSAARGGDLGMFPRGRMVPEFENAAFSLKTNQLSDVITTQFGYHLLLVTEHHAPREVSFAEAEADIDRYLTQQKQPQIMQQSVEQLRAKAKVEILLPEPPPAATIETPPVAKPNK